MKMKKAIDSVIADLEHSFSTESSHGIETKYSIPDKLLYYTEKFIIRQQGFKNLSSMHTKM